MEYSYKTKDVCSSEIRFRLDGDVVHDVRFTGGCNGNLKAIGILVEGLHVDEIEQKLRGNTCGPRDSSCADQLARAVREAYQRQTAEQ
ncbi:MAG: TIGR03905 family TSCPD domain-containing protein [Oscillospiraceae bacterium]|nr:TIGR03905 family TSCPD domain-containing protein [Oscillospiraceae bacterium]